jgi:hypothetical protein
LSRGTSNTENAIGCETESIKHASLFNKDNKHFNRNLKRGKSIDLLQKSQFLHSFTTKITMNLISKKLIISRFALL